LSNSETKKREQEQSKVAARLLVDIDRLFAWLRDADEECARLLVCLGEAEENLGRVTEEEARLREGLEERLHEVSLELDEARIARSAAELEGIAIREAALEVASAFDKGDFDLLRGEISFQILDRLIAELG
jgi:Xaa-Pro aminopeptidase